MAELEAFRQLSTTVWGDVLPRDRGLDCAIRPLWPSPRIAGRAYTVRCAPGDNLMLHAAIYRAPAGAVIMVECGDLRYALTGGNVVAIAKQNGIAGFILDGVARDIGEIREHAFPVYARGLVSLPGVKAVLGTIGQPVSCGGVTVETDDIVIADEDGVVVVPRADADALLVKAQARAAKDASVTLAQWERDHRKLVEDTLTRLGYRSP